MNQIMGSIHTHTYRYNAQIHTGSIDQNHSEHRAGLEPYIHVHSII